MLIEHVFGIISFKGVRIVDYSGEPHGLFFMIDNKSFYASVECVARGLDPLKAALIVMSETKNTGRGLVLAASPTAKREFGISNVDRAYEVPSDPRLMVVPPRMNLYIKKNLAINNIFREFVADAQCVPYSIDESILDMTHSWRLFGRTPDEVARLIQRTVYQRLGLYVTVGIGENPVQAKLALDLLAKHSPNLRGTLTYQSFADHIWPINDLTKIWSIGQRTANHLYRLGIHSMGDLAKTNPYWLGSQMGIIGKQLYALSWGIDRSMLDAVHPPRERSWSNSQVLPRDYNTREEIEVVIREIGQQVTSRMRHHHEAAGEVDLWVGFSGYVDKSGFTHHHRIPPTDDSREIVRELLLMFEQSWQGETVRNIAVSLGRLSHSAGQQLSLFKPVKRQVKQHQFDQLVDQLRDKFGPTAVFYGNSIKKGGTMLERAGLVGGHNGGNSFE